MNIKRNTSKPKIGTVFMNLDINIIINEYMKKLGNTPSYEESKDSKSLIEVQEKFYLLCLKYNSKKIKKLKKMFAINPNKLIIEKLKTTKSQHNANKYIDKIDDCEDFGDELNKQYKNDKSLKMHELIKIISKNGKLNGIESFNKLKEKNSFYSRNNESNSICLETDLKSSTKTI